MVLLRLYSHNVMTLLSYCYNFCYDFILKLLLLRLSFLILRLYSHLATTSLQSWYNKSEKTHCKFKMARPDLVFKEQFVSVCWRLSPVAFPVCVSSVMWWWKSTRMWLKTGTKGTRRKTWPLTCVRNTSWKEETKVNKLNMISSCCLFFCWLNVFPSAVLDLEISLSSSSWRNVSTGRIAHSED